MQFVPPSFEAPLSSTTATQLVSLLERHRAALPFAEEELARHHALRSTLVERQARSEDALNAWRSALSHRWECEVRAQRTFSTVQRRARSYVTALPAYQHLVASPDAQTPVSHTGLLSDLRRLAAALALLIPPPAFVAENLVELQAAADELAAAIEMTGRCEATRRQMLLEERLTENLYLRTCAHTHRLISNHFADGTSSDELPPLPA